MAVSDERQKTIPPLPPGTRAEGRERLLRRIPRGSNSSIGASPNSLGPLWATALREEVVGLRRVLVEQSSRYARLLEEGVSQLQREYEKERMVPSYRSVLLDLLLFLDKMNHMCKERESADPSSSHGTIDPLRCLIEELAMILYRCDVDPMRAPTSRFDERVQRVVEVVPTDKREEDGKVLGVVRHGFWHGKEVLRLEDVVVHRYEAGGEDRGKGV